MQSIIHCSCILLHKKLKNQEKQSILSTAYLMLLCQMDLLLNCSITKQSTNSIKSYQMALLAESRHNAQLGSYASLQHIIALTSVVGVKFRSNYPKFNVDFRFHEHHCFSQILSTESPSSMSTTKWSSCHKHQCSQL